MKRKLLFAFIAVTIILAVVFVNSCTKDNPSDCKTCQTQIFDKNTKKFVRNGSDAAVNACGSELELKQATAPQVIGDDSIVMVCK